MHPGAKHQNPSNYNLNLSMSRRVKITFGTFVSFQSWQNGSYRIPVLAHRSSVSVSPLHSAKPWGGSRSERESHVRQRSQTSPPTLLTLLSTNTKGKISDGSCNIMPKDAIIQVVYFIRDGSTVSLAHSFMLKVEKRSTHWRLVRCSLSETK